MKNQTFIQDCHTGKKESMSRQVVSPGFFLVVTSYHSGSKFRLVESLSEVFACLFWGLQSYAGSSRAVAGRLSRALVHIIQSLGNKAGEQLSESSYLLVHFCSRKWWRDWWPVFQAQLPVYAAKIGCADFLPKHFTPDMAVYPCVLKPSKVRYQGIAGQGTTKCQLLILFGPCSLSTLRFTSCFAQGEFGKDSYICNSRDDVHPGIHSWLQAVESLQSRFSPTHMWHTHNIIMLHNVPSSIMFKSEVQACSRLFQWQVGLARACAWQRRILRLAFGLPWKHHRYGWYEIYLRFLAATRCNS